MIPTKLTSLIKGLSRTQYVAFGILSVVILISILALGGNRSKPKPEQGTSPYQKSESQNGTGINQGPVGGSNELPPIIGQEQRTDVYNYQSADAQSRETARGNIENIETSLPLYVERFKTSVGKSTAISIYAIPGDPVYTLHLEINNIDYQNMESDPVKNSDVVAFKESYVYAKTLIRNAGADPDKIFYIFGTKKIVQETAAKWVSELKI